MIPATHKAQDSKYLASTWAALQVTPTHRLDQQVSAEDGHEDEGLGMGIGIDV